MAINLDAIPVPPLKQGSGDVPAQDYTTVEGREKLLTETEKVRVDIEKVRIETANLLTTERRAQEAHEKAMRSLDTEIIYRTASAEAAKAEAARGNLVVEQSSIQMGRLRREEIEYQGADVHNRVFNIVGEIDEESVYLCLKYINAWHRDDPSKEITIVIDSPGGDGFAGTHLFDHIQFLRSKGQRFITLGLGACASMAGMLVQAGDDRVMGAGANMLLHEASVGGRGKPGELADMAQLQKHLNDYIVNVFSERSARVLSTREGAESYEDTLKKQHALIDGKWERKDWWLTAQECLANGFIDRIL